MSSEAGTRLKPRPRLPVFSVRVEVVDGPDRGRVAVADAGELSIGTASTNALVLTDPTVSRFHAEISLRRGRLHVADPGSTNGTRIGPVLLRSAEVELDAGAELVLGDTRVRIDLATSEQPPAQRLERFGQLWGAAASMRQPIADLVRVSAADVPVLLHGESGTGKELAARALHDHGARAGQPFVTVDCGAIAPSLVASQLFGHERGAFTGADRRHLGAFEQAHGGTVFLDEVGELPADLQAMLLGVLERRRFQRVGGRETVAVDVRVVSATHRDLRAAVNAGSFRLDLYYRLATVRVALPPLRDRLEDLRPLVQLLLVELGSTRTADEVFDHDAFVAFERHPWPGNVRELRNVVAGTLALGRATPLDPVPAAAPAGSDTSDESLFALDFRDAKRVVLDRFERHYLERLLARVGGNLRAASRESKLERNHLTELVRRHRLHPGSDKD